MTILTPQAIKDYELLDTGNGYRLERFGRNIVKRPDSNCVWLPQLSPETWANADVELVKNNEGQWKWKKQSSFKEEWDVKLPLGKVQGQIYITAQMRLSTSKNVGFFPENMAHWSWIATRLHRKREPKILNLFGYTGLTSIFMAAHGAQVCHVDASKPAVSWGRTNQNLSEMSSAKIRWIVDDCIKFLRREAKRGVRYDGIIMDPPAFGRSPKGKIFEFEKNICELIGLCHSVLSPEPLFFIFNGYSMGYSATVLKNLLADYFDESIEFGELHIKETEGNRTLPCSLFARIG